jgi:hypothetical protein
MLKLTLLTSENNNYSFATHFKSVFASVKPYAFKKDIWDFGDRLCVGNRRTNEVQLWEAIERTTVEVETGNGKQELYIDILNSCDETGFGPCERKTTESVRYDTDHISLEIDDSSETLLISLKNPEDVAIIYENLEYLLKDPSFLASKYDWIGEEERFSRPLYISKKNNDKKKKELLAKTPRIALTAVVNNNRKRR